MTGFAVGAGVVLVSLAAFVAVVWYWDPFKFFDLSDADLFGSEREADSFGAAFNRQTTYRDFLDCHYILRVFNRDEMKSFYGAKFDDNGDVVALTEPDPELTGFITHFDTAIVAAMTDPAALRRHLGMSHPDYNARYGGDLYVVVFDLSSYAYEMNNWHTQIRNGAEVLPGYQDDGETTGGSREMEIPAVISVKDRIKWVERVSKDGRHQAFHV